MKDIKAPQSSPEPVMIPGENLPLPESELLQSIGKYLSLLEWEQRKRLILAQAYVELKADRDALHRELESRAN